MAIRDVHDLGDDPLSDRPLLTDEAQNFVELLSDLLDEGRFQFAADTLLGIRETVRATGRITDKQRQAVANIQQGVETRQASTGWARRYEGYSR